MATAGAMTADGGGADAWTAGSHAALRELSALACVEVDWRTRRWGAVSPCLTLLPDAASHGLLVGARTARLTRESVVDVEASDALVYPGAAAPRPAPQPRAPDALFVAADSEAALASVAEALDIPYVHSLVERLNAVLPGLDAELAGRATPLIVKHYGARALRPRRELVPRRPRRRARPLSLRAVGPASAPLRRRRWAALRCRPRRRRLGRGAAARCPGPAVVASRRRQRHARRPQVPCSRAPLTAARQPSPTSSARSARAPDITPDRVRIHRVRHARRPEYVVPSG
jgi:hypothetical protein